MASGDERVGDIEKQILLHSPPPPPLQEISPTNSSTEPAADLVVVVENNNNDDDDDDDDKATGGVDSRIAAFCPPPSLDEISAPTLQNSTTEEGNDESAEPTINSPVATASLAAKLRSFVLSVLKCTGLLILCIVAYPFTLAYAIAAVCLTGSIEGPYTWCFSKMSKYDEKWAPDAKPKSIYTKMLEQKSTKDKIRSFNANNTIRFGCLALLWLVLTIFVPRLTSVMLFGGRLWKWSLLLVVILLGYPSTGLFIGLLAEYLTNFTGVDHICYWVDELINSLVSLLYTAFILVMWLFYFRTDKGLHPYKRVEDFATWTFVSLVVGAFLWVSKSAALLNWKGNAVYMRFKDRILTAGFKLFFLTQIINEERFEVLTPWRDDFDKGKAIKDGKNLHIQDYWSSQSLPICRIATVAQCLTDLARVTLRDNDGIPEIVAKCQEIATRKEGSTVQYITKEVLEENFRLGEEDAWILFQALKGELMSEEITYDAFRKWMVDAHKNCQSVGFTLIDAFAVISVLNKVLMGVIVVAVIILWLLITGLGTTNVLVLVASPLLALSFVFGDTCKTFFQGIIFSFVTHPFDIGDRCVINGIELEVKRIGILTTMFVKIGTKEKVMHPNTSLATLVITNLEGEPDPSDMIELTLDSSTSMSNILSFKADLKSFFASDDRHGFYEKTIRVAVEEIGSSIKVGISFTHVMNVQDVSHSQCLLKKKNRRSELLVNIKQLLEKNEIKLAAMIVEILAVPKEHS